MFHHRHQRNFGIPSITPAKGARPSLRRHVERGVRSGNGVSGDDIVSAAVANGDTQAGMSRPRIRRMLRAMFQSSRATKETGHRLRPF